MAVLGLRFCARAFSSCGKRGHSSSRCAGLSLWRPLLLWSTGSRRAGSVIVAHGPSCSAACGIFPDQGVPCIGRQILNHCATRETPPFLFIIRKLLSILLVTFECLLCTKHSAKYFMYIISCNLIPQAKYQDHPIFRGGSQNI